MQPINRMQNKNVVKINNMILTSVNRNLYEQILTKLYNKVNIYNIRYQLINDKKYLHEIKDTCIDGYVTYHIQGYNYLLFMTLIDNKQCVYLISKKELKFYMNQVKMDEIKIYTLNIKKPCSLNMSYFADSIFDGKILRLDNNEAVFLIYDCYSLCSQDMLTINLTKKFDILDKLLNEINLNIVQENMSLKLTKLYKYEDIPLIVYEKVKSSKWKIILRGSQNV